MRPCLRVGHQGLKDGGGEGGDEKKMSGWIGGEVGGKREKEEVERKCE